MLASAAIPPSSARARAGLVWSPTIGAVAVFAVAISAANTSAGAVSDVAASDVSASSVGASDVAASAASDEDLLCAGLGARERVLDAQQEAALATARAQALDLYRIAQHRQLTFVASPEHRLEDARAFDLALTALRRSSEEKRAIAHELDLVRDERATLASVMTRRARSGDARTESDVRTKAAFLRPLKRGTPVAVPGLRRDGPTKVELRHDDVDLLARMNAPVRAVAAGVIKRVELLPEGGFAVVTLHADRMVSIVSGLRDVVVRPAATVEAGQTLGLAGRNLDGAAVVSVEIWRDRHPQDAARLLRVRL